VLLVVGRIGRAHGVLGEATIEVRTDVPDERFYIGAKLVTEPESVGPLTITAARDHNGILLLKFAEANSRNEIEKFRETLLKAEVDMSQENLHEDEFHVQQLIGLTVQTDDGAHVGTLTDVLNLPGQDLLAVETENGEILIPFVYEIVPEIDLENSLITIVPPPGLLNSADAIIAGNNEIEEGE
jgi:16S rRNA processing protein RimM